VAIATARCSGALRCPPTGGTADKVRKNLSKIEVRSTRFLKKENNFFSKNEATKSQIFCQIKIKRRNKNKTKKQINNFFVFCQY